MLRCRIAATLAVIAGQMESRLQRLVPPWAEFVELVGCTLFLFTYALLRPGLPKCEAGTDGKNANACMPVMTKAVPEPRRLR